jgi:RNA polymerase sigma-70 factor, ECF subfamily
VKDHNSSQHKRQASSVPRPETRTGRSHLDVFSQYKPLLFSIAYRLLGSVADAEDKLQETFIRWQQSSLEEIESPRAFLVTVISRLCIQHLQSARVKREGYVGQWLPEPILTGNDSDPSETFQMQESLSMAFLLLLEKLVPIERAAFLLHDVFEYEYAEVAGILGKSEANCRQIVLRARQHVNENRPRFDASPEQHKKLLESFLAAVEGGDMQALLAVLSDDVVLYSDGGGKAAAALNPISGPDHVARFVIGASKKTVPVGVTMRIAQVNGQPSVIYLRPDGRPGCVLTLSIVDGRLHNIYVVTNPEKLASLPAPLQRFM